MSVEAYALTTLAAVKLRIGIDVGDTSNDTDLEAWINEISYMIHGDGQESFGHIGRYLIAQDYTDQRYQPSDDQDLLLDNYPINSFTNLEYGYTNEVGDFVSQDIPRYVFIHRKKYSLVKSNGWYGAYCGYSTGAYSGVYLNRVSDYDYTIKLDYNAGYLTIPVDIEGVVKNMVADGFSEVQSGGQGLKKYSIDDVSIEWMKEINPTYLSVVNRYRKRRF